MLYLHDKCMRVFVIKWCCCVAFSRWHF